MHALHEVPHALGLHETESLPRREEVAEALAHLLLVDLHEAVVHPMLGKALAEVIPTSNSVDMLSYPNQKEENNPRRR